MSDHFKNIEKVQELLQGAQTGLWAIELDEGKPPRMYADRAMLELLGFEREPSPEECYDVWFGRIDSGYYPMVYDAVERISANERAEVQYPWLHPVWGQVYVRCGGGRDWSYKDGVCLIGYHQNITNTVMLKQEYDTVIRTLNENYRGIYLCNIIDKTYKSVHMNQLDIHSDVLPDYEGFFRRYAEEEVAQQCRELFMNAVAADSIHGKLSEGGAGPEAFYQNKEGKWCRVRVLLLKGYTAEYPWVLVTLEDQAGEVEKRLNEAVSQEAVSRMYRLVVSVNLKKTEYHCVHYSGEQLQLSKQGSFTELYGQIAQKMPSEDRRELDHIFRIENYRKYGTLEGTFRMFDPQGVLHYYAYYSACIRRDFEERILMTVRNVDDRQEQQRREAVLANLCSCYYSIYLFDLEQNTEEAIWQEDIIRKKEFPKGRMDFYYDKFVQNYVCPEDREKMKRAGDKAFLQKTLSEEHPVYDIDFRRIYPDGTKWVRSRFSIAEIRDGEVTKVVFANMGIHEQKLQEIREEELNRQALMAAYEKAKNANEAKSSFLAQMSHDIRTPMNAIMGMTSIAYGQLEHPDKVKDCLDKIGCASRHLLELINKILDMAKIEKGSLELEEAPFILSSMLSELVSIMRGEAQAKDQEMRFEISDLVHDNLIGDAGRLSQVLMNLISNSVKYTPEHGKIHITLREVSSGTPGAGSFVFTVEDNGIGMSPDFVERIFVPFNREDDVRARNIQGTGLGMPIAREIINAMRGNIQVESQKGKGSRFVVTLTLKTAESEKNARKAAWEEAAWGSKTEDQDPPGTLRGQRLMLVEDNELNMEIAKTILEESGMAVDCAENGEEALQMFVRSKPGTYQAILMDLQMPVMDGYTAAREIRKSRHPQAAGIPIIALTANAFAEDIAKAQTAGMDDHIPKPIDFSRLLGVLQRYAGREQN